jgi:hypothetical protein
MHLCSTTVIQDAHQEALRASLLEILDLLAAQPADILQNALMSEGTVNGDMGKYHDDMD